MKAPYPVGKFLLAIVKAIVDAYGGSITASNGERGAVFTVRLPFSLSRA